MAPGHRGASCPHGSDRLCSGRRALGRAGFAIAVVPLLLVVLGPAQRATAQPPESLMVRVTDGEVAVQAVDVPLDRVLIELGEALHARIVIETVVAGELRTPVTRSFSGVPPVLAFRRLLVDRNYSMTQGPAGVEEVRIFRKGTTGFRQLTADRMGKGQPTSIPLAEPSPADPAELSRLRQVALEAPDASARRDALDELSSLADAALLRDTLTQALARERDGRVLERVFAVAAQQEDAVSAETLRSFVSSDRDGTARAQGVDLLAAQAGDDPATRALLRRLAASDASADVREAARTALHDLETPAPEAPPPAKRR
jgi:hypothetical protein